MAGPAYNTAVLDDFNRSNEGPPPSASWTGPIVTSSGSTSDLRVVSNALQTPSTGIHAEAYWNAERFAAPAEVFVTVTDQAREYIRLWLHIADPDTDSTDGYVLEFDYSSGTDTLRVYRVDSDVMTQLGSSISQEVASGDALGLSHDGSTITVWHKPAAGAWTSKGTRSDSTYTSGYIGCSIEDTSGSSVTLDDFGGGEPLPAAVTASASGTGEGTGQAAGSQTNIASASGSGEGTGAAAGLQTQIGSASGSGVGTGAARGSGAAADLSEAPARISVREFPPLRQYLIAITPSGKAHRWGEDDPNPVRVLDDLEDSDSMPGGYAEMRGGLPRRFGVDYSDMQPGTHVEIYGAGQRQTGEFRLERAPQITEGRVIFEPEAVGYKAHLEDDKSAREIFIDADVSSWGEPSAARMLTILGGTSTPAGRNQYAPSEIGLADDAQRYGPGVVQKLGQVTTGTTPFREAWYHGGGVDIGKLRFDARQLTAWSRDANMLNRAHLSSDDIATVVQNGTDYDQVTTLDQTLTADGAGYKRAIIQMLYAVSLATNDYTNAFAFLFLKVLGRHGLTEYGTWPNIGFLASDIIAYALGRWAPQLTFTTGTDGTITPTDLPIPHIAFKEFTSVAEMIRQSNRFNLDDYAVWNRRTFYLHPRNARGRRWRLRVRPTRLRSTGEQMDRVWNGIIVQWQSPDGTTRTIGPPGSGADVISELLLDTDPLNPANQIPGLRRWDQLVMKGKSAISGDYNPPLRIGQRFLEATKALDTSGEAVVTGFARTDRGALMPYYDIHAGDLAAFDDASATGYRRIIDVKRNRKARQATLTLDAPPDDLDAVLERLDVELIPLGLG